MPVSVGGSEVSLGSGSSGGALLGAPQQRPSAGSPSPAAVTAEGTAAFATAAALKLTSGNGTVVADAVRIFESGRPEAAIALAQVSCGCPCMLACFDCCAAIRLLCRHPSRLPACLPACPSLPCCHCFCPHHPPLQAAVASMAFGPSDAISEAISEAFSYGGDFATFFGSSLATSAAHLDLVLGEATDAVPAAFAEVGGWRASSGGSLQQQQRRRRRRRRKQMHASKQPQWPPFACLLCHSAPPLPAATVHCRPWQQQPPTATAQRPPRRWRPRWLPRRSWRRAWGRRLRPEGQERLEMLWPQHSPRSAAGAAV
jgi:hypothetical protein